MQLDTLRMIVGFSIIGSHLVSFLLILIGTDKFTMAEKTELSLLISPVFAVYVTAIVRRFTATDASYDRSPTHPALRIFEHWNVVRVRHCAASGNIFVYYWNYRKLFGAEGDLRHSGDGLGNLYWRGCRPTIWLVRKTQFDFKIFENLVRRLSAANVAVATGSVCPRLDRGRSAHKRDSILEHHDICDRDCPTIAPGLPHSRSPDQRRRACGD